MKVKPIRIQRKRTKGFNLQKASTNGLPVVYVGRPTRWGNPYSVEEYGREKAIELFQYNIMANEGLLVDIQNNLKGKNLACFCSLDCACHADVLLEIANN